MNALILYLVVASIALFFLYFVKRPRIDFIQRHIEYQRLEYVEWVPFNEEYFQNLKDRYVVLKGCIRSNGEYFNGWYVYDISTLRYVNPNLKNNSLHEADKLCDRLNDEEQLYNHQINTYTTN